MEGQANEGSICVIIWAMKYVSRALVYVLMVVLCLLALTRSALPIADATERIRTYTRMLEFNYVNWTFDALGLKWAQAALDAPRYWTMAEQRDVVDFYVKTLGDYYQVKSQIAVIYADPAVSNPDETARELLQTQVRYQQQLADLAPLTEQVLQMQVGSVLAEQGLSLGGQPLPPLLYHVTPLPYALIVSPRDSIRQEANISLLPDLTLEQITRLEKQVEAGENVSALVTPIGGVGTYPTMVASSTNLPWLIDTVAHEWTHNYLTLRPMGLLYDKTAALRTMNETTAQIAGEELSRRVLELYYPDLLPPPAPVEKPTQPAPAPSQPPAFDFREEMYQTRLAVDTLLSLGKVEQAEKYMEVRRLVFWENGYQIRRLNQAYFAFYGAYAAGGVGAQGNDPVGPAVRTLRAQAATLADFLNEISWLTSFEALQNKIEDER